MESSLQISPGAAFPVLVLMELRDFSFSSPSDRFVLPLSHIPPMIKNKCTLWQQKPVTCAYSWGNQTRQCIQTKNISHVFKSFGVKQNMLVKILNKELVSSNTYLFLNYLNSDKAAAPHSLE